MTLLPPFTRRTFLSTSVTTIGGLLMWRHADARQGFSFAAYHDATGDDHQAQFSDADGLLKQGFRIKTMTVYRTPQGTRYAAVWTTEKGPAWQAAHGLSSDGYQQFFDTWTKKGYRPVIVTAVGGGVIGGNQTSDPVFATVFEMGSGPFTALHGIDFSTFNDRCDWAKKNQHVLRSVTVYGGLKRAYAAVWEHAPGVEWDTTSMIAIDGPDEAVPALVHPKNAKLRLAYVNRSPFAEYLSVYRSDRSSTGREVRGQLTSSQYQAAFDQLTAQGFYPACLSCGGDPRVSDTPRFVALFEKPPVKITFKKGAIGALKKVPPEER